MNFLDIVVTANRNLFRSKLRTILTVLAIFVGGFTLTLTTALNTGANDYLDRQLGNVSVPGIFEVFPKTEMNPFGSSELREYDPENKTSSFDQLLASSMTQKDIDKLAAVDGVDTAEPYYILVPEYISRNGGMKYELSQVSQYFGLNLDLASGRLLESDDRDSVILPENYLSALELDAESAIGQNVVIAYRDKMGEIVERQFEIVGVMNKTFMTAGQLFIDVDTAHAIAEDQGTASRYSVSIVRFGDVVDSVEEAELKKRLQEAGNFTAASLEERISGITSVVQAITAALNIVGIIALFAASFGIINTLLMSVYERTKEIGLMKALGMKRARVFLMFAVEATLVGFWGAVVAISTASLASVYVNRFASDTFLKDFEGFTLLMVDWRGALTVLGIIMLISFIAGTLPALKASRLNPIEALRTE